MTKKSSVLKKDRESGSVYLRDAYKVAFFLPTPIDRVVDSISAGFDRYLDIIPEDALRWASVGASSEEWKPVNKTTFQRCRAQLKASAAAKRSLTAFELADGDQGGDAPAYSIEVIGNPYDPEAPDELSLLEMSFPIEEIDTESSEHLVDHICSIAELVPYVSGYASPALNWSQLHKRMALKQARALANRYPGYDVAHNSVGRTWLGKKVRGARWLNFLGPELTKQLGGVKALEKAFGGSITVTKVGQGIMIRAGVVPEVGDVNRKEDVPILRDVARVLQPVTAFGEIVLLRTDFAGRNESVLKSWERRFLD